MKIKVVEVGPRDGLQNESQTIPTESKVQLIKKLAEVGLKNIEVGAFVSPKWIPQMADTLEVVKQLYSDSAPELSKKALRFSALVPNQKGMELALKTSIREVAVFGACSETFSKKNINCSIAESFERFTSVMGLAASRQIRVRGYLSTAFGCPYEGKVSPAKVARLAEKMLDLGVYEVSIGDTIGVATPKQVQKVLDRLEERVPLDKVAMHFHDTRGTALANVTASLEYDIRTFDSSVGGLGGCPYAKGSSGNLATEDLVYLLHGMGLKTGVDLEALIKIKPWLEKQLDKKLPSRVGRAGLPLPGTL